MMGQTYADNMTGTMAAATAEAMKNAASNEGGAMMGFAGLNFAQNSGNNIMNTVAGMATNNAQANEPTANNTEASVDNASDTTADSAGTIPNFCPNCGAKTNGTNFCSNCGAKLN